MKHYSLTFFGARASEAIYDQRNDVWELHNSEAIGDYYLSENNAKFALTMYELAYHLIGRVIILI